MVGLTTKRSRIHGIPLSNVCEKIGHSPRQRPKIVHLVRTYSSSHMMNAATLTTITDQVPVTSRPSEDCGYQTSDFCTVAECCFAMRISMAN